MMESCPEWPAGLGDPRVTVQSSTSDVKSTAIDRRDVVARIRRAQETQKKATPPKKRPHIRQFQDVHFPPPRCSAQLHCHAALATKTCHSCAKFDDARLGLYCELCFSARHPSHRLPHVWSAVEDASNQEQEWLAHVTRHHLEQDAAELRLLLADTQAFLARPGSVSQATTALTSARGRKASTVDFQAAFTSAAAIHGTLRGLLEEIHEQLAAKPPLTREEALLKIQSMWRLRKARKQLKALVRDVYASFQDPATGETYYYNTLTKETQWTKPAALGAEELTVPAATTKKPKPAVTFASRAEQEQHAVRKLQAMARAHAARRHMRRLLSSVYEKIWDVQAERFYYHNTRTKEVKWEKPRWVSDEDLPTPRARYEQQQRELEMQREAKKAKKALESPLTQEQAACMLQRAYRRRSGFRRLLLMCRSVYERIYDPEQQRYYYHNTRTQETTWEKPLLLRDAQADVFTPRTRAQQLKKLSAAMKPRVARPSRQWTEEEAATQLQGLYRARKARRELGDRLVQRFKQAVDPSSGLVYYVDVVTQEVSWEPPALLLKTSVQIQSFE